MEVRMVVTYVSTRDGAHKHERRRVARGDRDGRETGHANMRDEARDRTHEF